MNKNTPLGSFADDCQFRQRSFVFSGNLILSIHVHYHFDEMVNLKNLPDRTFFNEYPPTRLFEIKTFHPQFQIVFVQYLIIIEISNDRIAS